VKINIKKLCKDAVIPGYSKPGDAGLDLTMVSSTIHRSPLLNKSKLEVDSGIAVEIPDGYVGLVFPRSSIKNTGVRLTNSVGVIDSGYRNSIKAFFDIVDESLTLYEKGDRFAQLIIIPYPQIEFEEVNELSDTERGTGGFGSSGN
jgi:dUTP pyrophosphatase